MSRDTDVAIVGGGHNGLVCAFYLARAGLKVRMLERRHIVGGAAVTEEFHPGFRNSTASYTVSLLRPKVIADIGCTSAAGGSSSGTISNFLPTGDGGYLSSAAAAPEASSPILGPRCRRPCRTMSRRWQTSPMCLRDLGARDRRPMPAAARGAMLCRRRPSRAALGGS